MRNWPLDSGPFASLFPEISEVCTELALIEMNRRTINVPKPAALRDEIFQVRLNWAELFRVTVT